MNTVTESKRQDWLDIARGLGIIFVMIGHAQLWVPAFIVYIFHMPLFFFISGYCFSGEKYSGGVFLKKKAQRLMIPYYILGIPMLIACTIQDLYKTRFHVQFLNKGAQYSRIFDYLVQNRFGTLWYISCLFFMTIIFYFLMKLLKQDMKKMLIAALIMLVVARIYYAVGGGALWFNIDVCFTMMIFYLAGYAARKYQFFEKQKIASKPMKWFVIFIIISLVLGTINLACTGKKVDIYWNDYGIWPLMYLGSFAGVFAILCLSRKLKSRFLKYVGENSILFYALHQAITFPLANMIMIWLHWFRGSSVMDRTGQTIFSIVFSLIVWWIPTYFLKKVKWSKWIGL